MAIDLYMNLASTPCKLNETFFKSNDNYKHIYKGLSVMMTAKVIGVELNLKNIDLMTAEQMKPEFLTIQPVHKGK